MPARCMHSLWLCLALASVLRSSALKVDLADRDWNVAATNDNRVFVVVLGHGQEERSEGLSATLHSFQQQLGPSNFDCLIFVWNASMRLPDVPRGCEIKVTPGVFMEFTRQIPEDRLKASRYTFLMADDITLNVKTPMDMTALRDLADANCLDVISAAHSRPHYNYKQLAPGPWASAYYPGRLVEFIEWQAQLVSPTVVHVLQRLSTSNITGCWGYDSLLYSALQKWTRRTPRLGIADLMLINIGSDALAGRVYNTSHHPCGKVGSDYKPLAITDQAKYWRRHAGLQDFHLGHEQTDGYFLPLGQAMTKQNCAALLAPGELSLISAEPSFDVWLEALIADERREQA